MARGDLNVSIGALVDKFQRGIKDTIRTIRRFENTAQRIGTTLTQNITLPLVASGAGALKAAADTERYKLTLAAVTQEGGNVEDQLQSLRRIAENPAIGFEQAVQASARLQSVGLSASEAERTIVAFGNAVAASGRGVQEFDGAILALTQIAAKGKVFGEEIRQLDERINKIRPAIKEAFGAGSAEELQKLGVSAEDFIGKITTEFEKLRRVDSGLFNTFENAGIAIKLFAADIGDIINEVFNVQSAVNRFSESLGNLSQFIQRLSPEAQKFILRLSGIALAAGPAFLALSTGSKILRTFLAINALSITSFQGLANSLVNIRTRALSAAKAFQALSIAAKAGIFLGIGAAIAGLVAIFQAFNREIRNANSANIALKKVSDQASASIAEQKLQTDRLVAAATNEASTKREQRKALQELQKLSPEYFGNLKLEKGLTEQLTKAATQYNSELLRRAKLQAANQELIEIERQLLQVNQLRENAKPTFAQDLSNFLGSFGNLAAFAAKRAGAFSANLEDNRQALERQKNALIELVQELDTAGPKIQSFNNDFTSTSSGQGRRLEVTTPEAIKGPTRDDLYQPLIDSLGPSAENFRKSYNDNLLKTLSQSAKPVLLEQTQLINDLQEGLSIASQTSTVFANGPLAALTAQYQVLGEQLQRSIESFGIGSFLTQELQERYAELGAQVDQITNKYSALTGTVNLLSPAFDKLFTGIANNSKSAFADFGNAIRDAIKQLSIAVGKALALAAVVSVIGSALGIPPAGLKEAFGIGGGGNLFGGLFKRFAGFASGGLVTKPTAGIIGEAGPEFISRLDQPGRPFGTQDVTFKISGQDLYFIMKRAEVAANRGG